MEIEDVWKLTKPRLHVTTAHQFPLFLPDLAVSQHREDLYAGVGVVVFDGPYSRRGDGNQAALTLN